MKKLILSIAVIGASVFNANAQQDPQYTQFMFDKLSVNPGVTGINGMYCGTVLYRNQWMGFDGAPKTILFNASGPVDILKGGVGLSFYNDKIGFESNNLIRLSYAYHQPLGNSVLGIGLSAGYAGKSLTPVWQPGSGVPDPQLTSTAAGGSNGAFDLNFGVYFKDKLDDRYYAGISATHLTAPSLSAVNIDIARHMWVMGGYKYDLGASWDLLTDVLAKSDFKSTQVDLGVRGLWNKKLWFGASYRHQDAVSPMVGYRHQLKTPEGSCSKMFVSFGASYDVTLSGLSNYSSGTMELFAKFCFSPCKVIRIPPVPDVRRLGS